jgi:hypothetical protein
MPVIFIIAARMNARQPHKFFARPTNYRSILASVVPKPSPQTPRHASPCAIAPPGASRWHARGRLTAQIPIAEPAGRPTERTLPRFRALALFGRRSPERAARSSPPASENLHRSGHPHHARFPLGSMDCRFRFSVSIIAHPKISLPVLSYTLNRCTSTHSQAVCPD